MKTAISTLLWLVMFSGCGQAGGQDDVGKNGGDLDAVSDSRLPDGLKDSEPELPGLQEVQTETDKGPTDTGKELDDIDGADTGTLTDLDLVMDLDLGKDSSDIPADFEVVLAYECPAGLDGKKDLMPECPYDDISFIANSSYNEPVQFELFDESVVPGLPEGFEPVEGQKLVLLRVRWADFWTDTYVDLLGCPPEWPGCKGCGGHCFPHQDYVYVIDIESRELVFSAKETFSSKSQVKACTLADGSPMAFCWEVEVPSQEVTIRFSSLGSNMSGTTNVMEDQVQVYQGASWTSLATIPLPLF